MLVMRRITRGLRLCPKCESVMMPCIGGIYCVRCGYSERVNVASRGFVGRNLDLDEVERLIVNERREAVRDLRSLRARVVDVSHGIAVLEVRSIGVFQPGDPVGIIAHGLRFLGTVLDASIGQLTIILAGNPNIGEGRIVRVFNYEPLISYDLQLSLINYLKSLPSEIPISISNQEAFNIVLNMVDFPDLKYSKLHDCRDVRDGFRLDSSQVKAVEAALALEDNELLLIIGPPGTGKTRVIAKIAYELASKGEKILISSHTNRAVDNAIELLPIEITLRVGRPEKILENVKPYLLSYRAREKLGEKLRSIENEIRNSLELIRKYMMGLGGEAYKENIRECKHRLKILIEDRNNMVRMQAEKLVYEAKIIGSTLVKSQLPPLHNIDFDTVIIDEASQASVMLALLGMIKGRKWIVVGDHKQLLPIFKSARNYELNERLSVFVNLLRKYEGRSLWLQWHYRSNRDIIGFPAEYVYNGRIKPVDKCIGKILKGLSRRPSIDVLNPEKPVVFIHVDGSEEVEGRSRFNVKEIEATVSITHELIDCGINSGSIGIISPYRAQKARIAEKLGSEKEIVRKLESMGESIEIDTVDSFQGREKDVVIFTVTATNIDGLRFVSNENRLNVAFTRPKYKLIVIGNGRSIYRYAGETLLYRFLEYTYKLKAIWSYEDGKWMSK